MLQLLVLVQDEHMEDVLQSHHPICTTYNYYRPEMKTNICSKLKCVKITKKTKYYNDKLTLYVGHFQNFLLGFSLELDMNILMVLLQPQIGNSLDDD
jgi:hypothetical protein